MGPNWGPFKNHIQIIIIINPLKNMNSSSTAPPGEQPVAADRNLFRLRTLIAMFMAESLALAILQLPIDLDFHTFAVMEEVKSTAALPL